MPNEITIRRALNRANLIKNGHVQVVDDSIINEDFVDGLIHALEWVSGEIDDEAFIMYPRGTQEEEFEDEDDIDGNSIDFDEDTFEEDDIDPITQTFRDEDFDDDMDYD